MTEQAAGTRAKGGRLRQSQFAMLKLIGVLFLAGLLLYAYQAITAPHDRPNAADGVLDAGNWDFAGEGPIPLSGEWMFYPGLLTPEDFRRNPELAGQGMRVRLPGNWDSYMAENGVRGMGAGTYRLEIKLRDSGMYGLRMKKVRLSSKVFLNGEYLGGTGETADNERDFVPSNLPFYGVGRGEAGTAELLVQVSNYILMTKNGMSQAPEFGYAEQVMNNRDRSRLEDMALVTAMLVFGFYFAGMFRQWREERHYMYLSLFCLSTGLFFSIDNEILASLVVPQLPFIWLHKLLFILAVLSFYFFVLYMSSFLQERVGIIRRGLPWILAAYIGMVVLLPNEALRMTFWPNLVFQGIAFLAIFYLLYRGFARSSPVAWYLAMVAVFMAVTAVSAQFRYQMARDNATIAILSPLLLVFSQALLANFRAQQIMDRSRRLSEQLLEYDKQKDEFLARTSHELRTPLHGMINLSQILLDDRKEPLSAAHREQLRMLNLSGRRLADLVQDIMDLNLIRTGEIRIRRTAVDLGLAVRLVLDMLAVSMVKKNVELKNELADDLPLLYADENRLKQILHNLAENALKFTERGYVRISARVVDGMMAISVEDTGCGIHAKALDRIFQPFQQAEGAGWNPGVGLGLSITRQLVELQDGTITVRSEPGMGSCFTFTLPIARSALSYARTLGAGETELPEAEHPARPRTVRSFEAAGKEGLVLLVDDEEANLNVLMEVAASMGWGYKAFTGGADALVWLEGAGRPELVLLDLMMPVISGLDICREIRKRYSHAELPVLMLTASGRQEDVVAAFEAGTNDILQKPFELAELRARAESLLAMKRASRHAVQNEMEYLQAQITPHFLYNSLNSLIGLSYKDPDKLRETIYQLTTYLRAKFTYSFQQERVPLQEELEVVRAYLAIEQLRFGPRLQVSIEIDPDTDCMMPPLLLQPLVENAVRHGIGQKPEGGKVEIRVKRRGGGTSFTVSDNGAGMSLERLETIKLGQASGVGIRNVSRRLQMLYGERLWIESVQHEGTVFTFQLPEEPYIS
jgi:two-component system, sensor histidine kinase ChiS